jgi:queuine tRNA-ribosyltransferase catalytic subunit
MENHPLKVAKTEELKSIDEEAEKQIKMNTSALKFKIVKQWNLARVSVLTLPHGDVRTPVYMPVGTKGAMKGLLPHNMKNDID